jgi:predicted GNAT family N-acyltransferase
MALKIIDYGSPEYKQMVQLRYNMLRKPLGLEFDPKELENERNDILLGCFDDGKLEGCCLLTQSGTKEARLRQMAVISGLQGKGIGKALIQFAENIAHDRGFKTICMHARKSAMGFYEKLGYEKLGEEFTEVTLPHFKMEKKL